MMNGITARNIGERMRPLRKLLLPCMHEHGGTYGRGEQHGRGPMCGRNLRVDGDEGPSVYAWRAAQNTCNTRHFKYSVSGIGQCTGWSGGCVP